MRLWPNGTSSIPTVTDEFGTSHPLTGTHRGIDLIGFAWVRAADGGLVIWSGENGTAGYEVTVLHDDGHTTRYLHMVPGTLAVRRGARVVAGQALGVMGASGWVTGVHLHFEVIAPDRITRINPRIYITAGDPAGGGETPFPAQPEEEEDDMPRTSGFYYTRSADKANVFLIVNYGSGAYHEYSGTDGGYNNAVAAAFDTNSFAKITEGHANVIKASCERLLKR